MARSLAFSEKESNVSLESGLQANWDQCLGLLENMLPRPTFEMFLAGSRATAVNPKCLCIHVAHGYALDLIRKSSRRNMVECPRRAVQEVLGDGWSLEWACTDESTPVEASAPPQPPVVSTTTSAVDKLKEAYDAAHPNGKRTKAESPVVHVPKNGTSREKPTNPSTIEDRYRFDNFVVGASNQLATKAARDVAEHPGHSFNPLVIYGNAGLGKTHLMKAVRHHVLTRQPNAKVIYASSESFTNDLVESLTEKRTASFRRKYRHVDVLLIDDVEFLIGKERIQEEFYHTFEDLAARGKQLILTSDRPPHLLTQLQERLASRLSSGLIADVKPPTLEMRMQILRRLSVEAHVMLPAEVISFLANNISGNVRLLEGAMKRVLAFAHAHGSKQIDLAIVGSALDGLLVQQAASTVGLPIILEKVSEYYRIPVADLTGGRRDRRFSAPRHVAMYLAQELAAMRCREIGEAFGGKDYSTVNHAIKKIEAQRDEPALRTDLRNINAMLGRDVNS